MFKFRNLIILIGCVLITETVLQNLKSQPEPSQGQEVLLENREHLVPFSNAALYGTVNLRGGTLDSVILREYTQDGENIHLLSPRPKAYSADYPYEEAIYGWESKDIQTPNLDTLWKQAPLGDFTPENPLVLQYMNPQGILFQRHIEMDDKFLFTITQWVENTSSESIVLSPYASIRKDLQSTGENPSFSHAGIVGGVENRKIQLEYDLMRGDHERWVRDLSEPGYIGYTDPYWLRALAVGENPYGQSIQMGHLPDITGNLGYDIRIQGNPIQLAPGQSTDFQTYLYTGTKDLATLDEYAGFAGVQGLRDSIDWGWFQLVTKPATYALEFLYAKTSNMAVALVLLGMFCAACFMLINLPAHIASCKKQKIQHLFTQASQEAEAEGESARGAHKRICEEHNIRRNLEWFPIFVSILWFFAILHIVANAAILHSAYALPWIQNLSDVDPSSLMNLYGLLPWSAPETPSIGILVFINVISLLYRAGGVSTPEGLIDLRFRQIILLAVCAMFTFMPAGVLLLMMGGAIWEIIGYRIIRKFIGVKPTVWKNILVTLEIQRIP